MNPRASCVGEWLINALTIFFTGLLLTTGARSHAQTTTAGSGACVGDSGGITLSPGFCATVFADKLGHARHLAAAPNGVLYVNTWSGRYYHNDTPPPGGFLIALQDTKGDGRADKTAVQSMITRLLALPAQPPPDAADALALACCHLGRTRLLDQVGT